MDRVVKFILEIMFILFYRVEIRGFENVPKKGGFILCSNHFGELDMFFAGYKIKRIVHYMAKAELFENPISAWFLRGVGAFPVRRGVADIGAAKTVYSLLKKGEIVGILPEGTRVRNKDINDVKIKSGAAMFAINTGVPILPVAVEGSYKLFSKIRVTYGKPYHIKAPAGRKPSMEELSIYSREIMDKVYSLMEVK